MENKEGRKLLTALYIVIVMLAICAIALICFTISCFIEARKLNSEHENVYPEPEYVNSEDAYSPSAGVATSVDIKSLGISDLTAGVASALQDVPDDYLDEPEAELVALEQYQQDINYVEMSEEEKRQLASLIYLEARGESIECQYAVGSVVLNRYTTGCYDSIGDVIYEYGQFEPAEFVASTEPSDIQLQIVENLVKYGPTIPEYVTYFREGRYHNYEETEDFCYIDSTYFSYDVGLYEASNR